MFLIRRRQGGNIWGYLRINNSENMKRFCGDEHSKKLMVVAEAAALVDISKYNDGC